MVPKSLKQTALLLLLLMAPILAFSQSGSTVISGNSSVTGDATILGAVSKGGGTFMIDHPLDPDNKLLIHSFVESPDVKNLYDGIVELDENGEAEIELPEYFLVLNEDFRYLLTPVGSPAPDIYIKHGVETRGFWFWKRISFEIAGGEAGQKISWQVTGNRHDPYIEENPIIPEVEKGPDALVEKGEYLFPELYK